MNHRTEVPDHDSIEQVVRDCRAIIRLHATGSAAANVIPVPGVDIPLEASNAAMMSRRIIERFGLLPEQLDLAGLKVKAAVLREAKRQGCTMLLTVLTKKGVVRLAIRAGVRTTVARSAGRYLFVVATVVFAVAGYVSTAKLGRAVMEECLRVRRAVPETSGIAKRRTTP